MPVQVDLNEWFKRGGLVLRLYYAATTLMKGRSRKQPERT